MDISRAIARINSQAQYLLASANATSWNDIVEWYGPGPKPTAEQLETAWQAVLAEDAARESTVSAFVDTAQGAVGKSLGALTAAERNALLAVLLFELGAIDRLGKVRPIQEWIDSGRQSDSA